MHDTFVNRPQDPMQKPIPIPHTRQVPYSLVLLCIKDMSSQVDCRLGILSMKNDFEEF
jgi:hypothetical protein